MHKQQGHCVFLYFCICPLITSVSLKEISKSINAIRTKINRGLGLNICQSNRLQSVTIPSQKYCPPRQRFYSRQKCKWGEAWIYSPDLTRQLLGILPLCVNCLVLRSIFYIHINELFCTNQFCLFVNGDYATLPYFFQKSQTNKLPECLLGSIPWA